MSDPVNSPSHYAGKIECIDAIESAVAGLYGQEAFCTANAIKYLWRWKKKNGAEDLKKAKWYIDRMLNSAEQPVPRQPITKPDRQSIWCKVPGCWAEALSDSMYCSDH